MDKYILTSLIIIICLLFWIVNLLLTLIGQKEMERDKTLKVYEIKGDVYKNILWGSFYIILVFVGVWFFSQP